MTPVVSPFQRALGILNSFLVSVFVTFLFDVDVTLTYFEESLIKSGFGFLVIISLFFINLIFYSGFYGCFLEMATNEQMVFTFKSFRTNIRKLWKICLFFSFLPLVVHFILFVYLRDKNLTIDTISAYLNIPTLLFLSFGIIATKYLRPLKLQKRKVTISLRSTGVIFILYTLYILNFHWPQFVQGPIILDPLRIATFLSKYIYLLSFLYISILILTCYPEIYEKYTAGPGLILIHPAHGGVLPGIAFSIISNYPPVFVILKTLTPEHYRIREFNRNIWHNRYYLNNKLVALTCYTSNSPEAYKIAKEFKNRGCRVIMGGPHVTYLPEEALEYCDSVVIGEVESVWKDIIKDYENGCLKKQYVGSTASEFQEEAHQAIYEELLQSEPAVIKDFLETTRGCKFRCHFCTIPGLSYGRVRIKPVFELVELIKKIKHRYRSVYFIDNNIYNDPAYTKELFKALKPLKIKWSTQSTIDIAKNDETLALAKESGCRLLMFGYEITGDSLEKERGGKFGMAHKYIEFSKKVQDLGIQIKGNFMFGFENDKLSDFFKIWKYCFKIRPFISSLALVTPLPGTQLFYDLIKENRITNLNWRNYTCMSLVFRHKRMNNFWLAFLYPIFAFFFILTTSRLGTSIILVNVMFIVLLSMIHLW